ncbi:MAG: hypothetical protein Q9206_006461 [Seirophora lacunosa]
MDPFSLIVGAAGLLGVVAKTIELTAIYLRRARRDAEAANELLTMLRTLETLLSHLKELLKNDNQHAFSNTSVLVTSTAACRARLLTVHTKLEVAATQPRRLLRWPLSGGHHRDMMQDLRAFAQWIQFALAIDGAALMSKTSDELVQVLRSQLHTYNCLARLDVDVQKLQDVVLDRSSQILDSTAALERQRVLNWISRDEPEQKHHEIRQPRLEGTGAWFLQESSFKLWRDLPLDDAHASSTLWCHGRTGSGKSILADQQHQTIERIVASLLKQLASSCLRLPTAVTALHKRLSEQEKTPQHQDLLLALTILCREQKKVFLVIDALDECDPSVRKELCGFLRTPVSHCIRTFVTSRYHPADIREFFSECPQIEIKADSSDLQMYMRHEIECSDWRGDIDDRLTEKIAITIVESAKDMFLLAVLHIRTVLLEPTVGQMIDTLTKLPENLEAAFKKTMLRIQDQSDHRRQLALICLTWIVYARRPLTFKELSDALAMTTKPELTAVNDTYKTFRPPLKMLIDCCHGLIAIDEESMVGTHVAAADDAGLNKRTSEFLEAKTQSALSHQIWQYTKGRRKNYWNADEAESCTGLHVASGFGLFSIAQELLSKYHIDNPTTMGTTPLIRAASSGFPDLVRLYLTYGADPTMENWYGTALHCAAEAGQSSTIIELLNAGVDVNIEDARGSIPLMCAVQTGHADAARTLLSRGSHVNWFDQSSFGETPLCVAVRDLGSPDLARTLLEYHADPNATTTSGRTPLDLAASCGDVELARMLLDHGADVNFSSQGGAALLSAATFNFVDMIELLLERGAAIDLQLSNGRSALYCAVAFDNTEAAGILLMRGADVELAKETGFTPLHNATRRNYTSTLQLLLSAGANINARSNDGTSALKLAIDYGCRESEELLRSRGAIE